MENRSKTVLAASSKKNIFFVSVNNLSLITKTETSYGNIKSIGWNSDNSFLAYAGDSDYLSISRSVNPLISQKFANEADQHLIYFSKNKAETIVTGGKKGVSMLWAIKGTEVNPIRAFSHEMNAVTSAVVLNNTDTIICLGLHPCNEQKSCIAYFKIDERARSPLSTLIVPDNEIPTSLAFSNSNKQHLGYSTSKGTFVLYDIQDSDNILSFKNDEISQSLGFNFLSSRTQTIVHAYSDGRIILYDLMNRHSVNTIKMDYKLSSFTMMNDDIYFISGTSDGKIYQHDIRNYTHPVDVLNTNSSSIDHMSLQCGLPTFPVTYDSPFIDASPISVKPSIRVIPEITHEISRTNGNKTKSKTSIFSLFASPAAKIKRKLHESPQISLLEREDGKRPLPTKNQNSTIDESHIQEILDKKSEKSKKIDISIKPRSAKASLNDSIPLDDDLPESSISMMDENIISNKMDLINLHDSIHVHVRDLTFELSRQLNSQTNELKNFFSEIIINSNKREQELINENTRLRKELLELREFIKNISSEKNLDLNL